MSKMKELYIKLNREAKTPEEFLQLLWLTQTRLKYGKEKLMELVNFVNKVVDEEGK